MPVTIRLIGFGDDKPPGFDAIGRRSIATESTLTIDRLLQLAGIEPAPDLIVMNTDSVIPRPEWGDYRVTGDTEITVLSAIEGG